MFVYYLPKFQEYISSLFFINHDAVKRLSRFGTVTAHILDRYASSVGNKMHTRCFHCNHQFQSFKYPLSPLVNNGRLYLFASL